MVSTSKRWINEHENFKNIWVCNKDPKECKFNLRKIGIYIYKYNSDNIIDKRKAKLVSLGYKQKHRIDYHKTFSPKTRPDSLRLIAILVSQYNFNIHQIDVKAAYLKAKLDEEIYIQIPDGAEGYKRKILKIQKSVIWFKAIWTLMEWNLGQRTNENWFNKDKLNNIICLLRVYIDDILITGIKNEIKKKPNNY